VEVFGPAAVMAVVARAAVVELWARHAAIEVWVLLPLQMVPVWRYWHWRQCHSYCLAALVSGMGGNSAWRIKVWQRQR